MDVRLDNVSKSYDNRKILDAINLAIHDNSIFCLVGKNGAGKTTLLNIITNIINPDEGSVSINSMDFSRNSIDIKKMMGLLLGNIYFLLPSFMVFRVKLFRRERNNYLGIFLMQMKSWINIFAICQQV
jgi:ABC-type multidrug transport system ATPase subunit